jgi:hypothetical protein
VAVAPNGTALVTDEKTNRAYAFAPSSQTDAQLVPDYTFIDKNPLPGETYKKLGGIVIDAGSNIYTVDAELNEVRKHTWDGARDPQWKFQQYRTEKEPFLKNAEGIAIDDERNILYVASEFDYVVYLFDSRTGGFLQKLIGARLDINNHSLTGKRVFTGSRAVFSGSPEGLSLMHDYLFAVDEFAGHVHIFDTTNPGIYNHDLEDLAQLEQGGRHRSGYIGFVGHAPVISHENPPYKKLIKHHKLNPAEYNAPGSLCSPDAVATYFDAQENEGYIAIADQCNYRIVVYRWSEIVRAAGLTRR